MMEYHPLEPFLPANAKMLFLDSFPPLKKRRCRVFFILSWLLDFCFAKTKITPRAESQAGVPALVFRSKIFSGQQQKTFKLL